MTPPFIPQWNKKNKKEDIWKKRYEALKADYEFLKQKRQVEIDTAVQDEKQRTKKYLYELEKEVVFWKEKAMNFKKFHQ